MRLIFSLLALLFITTNCFADDIKDGRGNLIAADEVNGVFYPRTKIVTGADGVNGGDLSSSNGLPVNTRTFTTVISSTPTINAGAYSSGQLVGGKITLANAARSGVLSGLISSVLVSDTGKQSANLDIVFFNADPSATTFTDQATFDIDDADLTKIVCVSSLTTHYTFNDNSASLLSNVSCPFLLASTSLYAAIVSRSSATFGATSAVQLSVGILQD